LRIAKGARKNLERLLQFSILNCLYQAFHSGMQTPRVLAAGSGVVGLAAASALDELGSFAYHLACVEA
jgi:NADPH-dependent 2,4-dienoyl-CoA reductase/sulfur reductase-like enzyme